MRLETAPTPGAQGISVPDSGLARQRIQLCDGGPGLVSPESLAHRWRGVGAAGVPIDIVSLARRRRCSVRLSKLRAAAGGDQALLLPRPGGYTIVVDEDPSAGERWEPGTGVRGLLSPIVRYRIAHEVGHTHFFDTSTDAGGRRSPPGPDEEEFCDRVAAALLVDPMVARAAATNGPDNVLALATAMVSPVRGVLESAAQAGWTAWAVAGTARWTAARLDVQVGLVTEASRSSWYWANRTELSRSLESRVHRDGGPVTFLAFVSCDGHQLDLAVHDARSGRPHRLGDAAT